MPLDQKQCSTSTESNGFKTSLTSRDTRKKSPNPSVSKTYSGFNHDAELGCRKSSQKIKSFWLYFT